jgi:hypothetical protein
MDDFAAYDRLFDDPRRVRRPDAAIPDALRIDDDCRPMFALIEATRVVDADVFGDARVLERLAEGVAKCLFPFWIAAAARMVGSAGIPADENVMAECWHPWRPFFAKRKRTIRLGNPAVHGVGLRDLGQGEPDSTVSLLAMR